METVNKKESQFRKNMNEKLKHLVTLEKIDVDQLENYKFKIL
jgi:hypothetical protein